MSEEQQQNEVVNETVQTPETVEAPAQVPETEQPAAQEEQPKPQVVLSTKALIQFLDADGKVEEERKCFRNIPEVIRTAGSKFKDDASRNVRITVPVEDGSPSITNQAGDAIDYVLAEGTLMESLRTLVSKAIPPHIAISELQKLVSMIADRSELKGIVLTAIFDKGQVGGFGMISSTADVLDEEIVGLMDNAAVQVKEMKDTLKKSKPQLKFAGDNGGLILPPRLQG